MVHTFGQKDQPLVPRHPVLTALPSAAPLLRDCAPPGRQSRQAGVPRRSLRKIDKLPSGFDAPPRARRGADRRDPHRGLFALRSIDKTR